MIEVDIQESRARLRREILQRRDALTPAQRHEKSAAIAGRLAELPLVLEAKTIFTYVNFRSEVETLPLIKAWLASGKRICVPLTLTAEPRLVAYPITDPESDLRPGYCQIPEPDTERLSPIDPDELQLIIMPGSVFDLHGGRLGYGGGYYDRFIALQAPKAIRIGLAFDLQLTDQLPLQAHDQHLHLLATEERVLHFTNNTPSTR
jgi:5-formyltetrahydrofolate cyclo-ligase